MKIFLIGFFSIIGLVVLTFALVGLSPAIIVYLIFDYLKSLRKPIQQKKSNNNISFDKIKLFLNEPK